MCTCRISGFDSLHGCGLNVNLISCWLQTTCLRAAGQDLLRGMPRLHADIPPGSAGEALDSEPEFNLQRRVLPLQLSHLLM